MKNDFFSVLFRRCVQIGMLAPMLVQMERQIDREIAADNRANGVGCGTQTENGSNTMSTGTDLFESDSDDEEDNNEPVLMYGPQPQIITNDLKSLDEMVSWIFFVLIDLNTSSVTKFFRYHAIRTVS